VTVSVVRGPGVFPRGGRRLVVYVVYDRRGGVDEYVSFALSGLREHAAEILVVVNGALTEDGRARLEPVSDEILVRENVGFDIWAHKAALDHVGERLAEFDEVVLTNDTWFGPVRPYGPVFERMNERPVHFWGMTDHAREEPNPFTGKGVLPYHLQSFWIAVRREMFSSPQWARYWRDLPQMPSYFDAVLQHEAVFTERFAGDGFTAEAAFPSSEYPVDHPALFAPTLLMDDGCPLLKRRPFFHWPPFLDRHAVAGRPIFESAVDDGYPASLIYENLARTVPPRVLNTNLALLDVLATASPSATAPTVRVGVVLHATKTERTRDLLGRIRALPGLVRVVVTMSDEDLRDGLAGDIARLRSAGTDIEVRPVRENAGRDMSAFFVDCRDLIEGDEFDVLVKLHDRRPDHRGPAVANYFARYHLDNLIGTPEYFSRAMGLFAREQTLGLAFPPPIHIGYAITGEGWSWYRGLGHDIAQALRIRVPLDGVSPLAPYGGMWIGRPAAMRRIASRAWTHGDFRDRTAEKIPDMGRTLERLLTAAAGEDGFTTRTIMTADHAAISHLSLEYGLDQLAINLPGYPMEQIQFVQRAGWMGTGGAVAHFRMYMRTNHPDVVRRWDPIMHPVGRAARVALRGARALARLARDARRGRRRP
jgi:lipopolysaccharide biosynthesis protein